MKLCIAVHDGPHPRGASSAACRFAGSAVARGHSIARVFFNHDGVHNARPETAPPPVDRAITECWSRLAGSFDIDLALCGSAAARRGVTGASPGAAGAPDLAPGFRLAGLGQFMEAIIDADRVLTAGLDDLAISAVPPAAKAPPPRVARKRLLYFVRRVPGDAGHIGEMRDVVLMAAAFGLHTTVAFTGDGVLHVLRERSGGSAVAVPSAAAVWADLAGGGVGDVLVEAESLARLGRGDSELAIRARMLGADKIGALAASREVVLAG